MKLTASLLISSLLPLLAMAQNPIYYFTGAVYAPSGQSNPSAAVPAQCPADHPVSCTNIQEPYYCCPSNNACSWNNNQVACCPNGQTCSGSVGGGGGYSPTSYYTPASMTTTYAPATTVVTGGGVVAPAGYATTNAVTTVYTTPQQYTTTQQQGGGGGGYCSTIYEVGPGLPTTRQGDCGTILIEEPNEAAKVVRGWVGLMLVVLGLQVLGGLLFVHL